MLVIICAHTHICVHVGTHLTVAWRMCVIWYGRQTCAGQFMYAIFCIPFQFCEHRSTHNVRTYVLRFLSTILVRCFILCNMPWIKHIMWRTFGCVLYVWQSLCLLARYTAIIHGMVSLMKSSCSFCSSYLHLPREREKNNRHKTVIASRFSI